jgi:hypothetical protein
MKESKQYSRTSNSILRNAMSIVRRADVSLHQIKKKATCLLLVLIIGLVGAIAAFSVIGMGLPGDEPTRLLMAFVMLGSLTVSLASGLALLVVLWNAYVYQYVRSLDAKAREADMIDQVPTIFETAVISIACEESFQREITSLIVSNLQRQTKIQVLESYKAAIEGVTHDPSFCRMLASVICKRMSNQGIIASFLEKDLERSQIESLALFKD